MLTVQQLQSMIGDTFFEGNIDIAGILMYAIVMGVIFALCKKELNVGILLMLPVTLVFSLMGVLSTEATLLMIVIAVLSLAMAAKKTFGD